MKRVRLKLELVTPAFLAGADQAHAEWRAASVRGQLRWWLRAVAGRDHGIAQVRKLETEIFGSTERRSPLTVRIRVGDEKPSGAGPPYKALWTAEELASEVGETDPETVERLVARNPKTGHPVPSNSIAYLGYGCLSWKGEAEKLDRNRLETRGILYPGTSATLTLQWRPREMPHEEWLRKTLWAWLNLGGLGAKGRKGFGSLSLLRVDGEALGSRDELQAPTLSKLLDEVKDRFGERAQEPPGDEELPEWSHLSPWSRVLVSPDHDRWEDALGQAGAWLIAFRRRYGHPGDPRNPDGKPRDYTWAKDVRHAPQAPDRGGFGLPLPFFKDILGWDDGGAGDGRRASPLLLHIACFGGRYHSVWTHLPARFLEDDGDLIFSHRGGQRRFPVTNEQREIVGRFLDWLVGKSKLREPKP